MNPDVLARLLLQLTAEPDRRANVIVATGAPSAACLLFTKEAGEGRSYLSWEASGQRPRSDVALAEQHSWLRRLRFRQEQDDEYRRRVAAPEDLGEARLIADLSAFLLERAFGVPAGEPVTMDLRAGPAQCPLP